MMPNPIVISNRNIVFVDPKEFDDPEVCDGLKDISNESMDFSDPKEFDDPQVFNDPNGISIGRMDFDNPKTTVIHPYLLVLFFKGASEFKIFARPKDWRESDKSEWSEEPSRQQRME